MKLEDFEKNFGLDCGKEVIPQDGGALWTHHAA